MTATLQNRASATVSLQIGPTQLGPAPARIVRLSLTESQAEKMGLAGHWREADARWLKRQAAKAARESSLQSRYTALKSSVQKMLHIAESESWSQRELARRSGLSWGAFRRCRDGQADPIAWLPKVQAAASSLQHSAPDPRPQTPKPMWSNRHAR